jgi:hypothetical protein
MIHVLPDYKLPVAKLPLQAFIESRIAWKKKMEKDEEDVSRVMYEEANLNRPFDEAEQFFK